MGKQTKSTVMKVAMRMLKPLVKILIRLDISHSEFVEMSKRAYVDVAYKDFQIPNRKNTYSRVAVITGLSRKEVVRQRKIASEEQITVKGPLNRASQVISGWIRDHDFLDEFGKPKVLSLRHDSPSFEQLAERYSGDITARAILDELLRVGAVEKVDDDKVRLLKAGYIPDKSETDKLDVIATCIADQFSTGYHNLEHGEENPYFQRQVSFTRIPESVSKEFKTLCHIESLELLLKLNQWLADKKENVQPATDEKTDRVGLGIYYFKNAREED